MSKGVLHKRKTKSSSRTVCVIWRAKRLSELKVEQACCYRQEFLVIAETVINNNKSCFKMYLSFVYYRPFK